MFKLPGPEQRFMVVSNYGGGESDKIFEVDQNTWRLAPYDLARPEDFRLSRDRPGMGRVYGGGLAVVGGNVDRVPIPVAERFDGSVWLQEPFLNIGRELPGVVGMSQLQ